MTKSNPVLPSSLSWPPSWWILCPQRDGPGVTGEGTVCARDLSSSPPVCCLFTCWVHSVTLLAISNNLCLEDALEEIFPHWALLQDQPGLIRIRSGLVWEAQDCLLHDWPAFKLCFYVSFALHGGDVLARVLLQRSVSLVLRHFEVLSSLLKGTLVFIWSNAALLPYSLSIHGVASLWK